MIASVAAAMQARGADAGTAMRRAMQLLDANVTRQATVMAYNRVFVEVAVMFAIAIPLVFALHRGRSGAGGAGMAAE